MASRRTTAVFQGVGQVGGQRYLFMGPGGSDAMFLSVGPDTFDAMGAPSEITVAVVPGARVGDVSLGISKVVDHG